MASAQLKCICLSQGRTLLRISQLCLAPHTSPHKSHIQGRKRQEDLVAKKLRECIDSDAMSKLAVSTVQGREGHGKDNPPSITALRLLAARQ